jgi:hypothetical protein
MKTNKAILSLLAYKACEVEKLICRCPRGAAGDPEIKPQTGGNLQNSRCPFGAAQVSHECPTSPQVSIDGAKQISQIKI